MNTREIGKKYEKLSAELLKNNNYNILETNYRIRNAEIDIIAEKNNLLVFVEVKYRKDNKFGYGSEAVDKKKLNKIISAAKEYIEEKKLYNHDIRIDCISYLSDKVDWIKNITWGDIDEF